MWPPGLRSGASSNGGESRVTRPGRHRVGSVACDSHAPGSTVDVDDLPPLEGVPASREDILRAWIEAQLGTGGSGVTISDDYILTIGA